MSKIIQLIKNKFFIQFLGVVAVIVLIWFVGPLISIAGQAILQTVLVRVVLAFVIILLWFAHVVWSILKQNKARESLMDDLSGKQDAQQTDSALDIDQEVDELKENFESAMSVLKSSGKQTRQGKHYLYDLPWYIIIGPPGSGKTTALVNSGLEFPLAEKFGKNAVKGVGGTRNCDWWFTDQAVMLDTAGRYTTQDSHQAVDKAAWSGFLDLLKKHRPRRPLNGVIVAISASDLLRLTEEERRLHAHAIRSRIEELSERLGIRLPIYLLLTKMDLVSGFTDFFSSLSRDQRQQVWGVTFTEDDQQAENLERIGGEFDQLLQRLNERVNGKLQDERDLQRRNLIFGFPHRMTLLKAPLISFIEECFSVNRYQSAPVLRGMYMTSGTQEGTPIDRLMGVLANTFRLERPVLPMFSGQGKSFFLTRLLNQVVFPESELVGLDQKVESRRRWGQRLVLFGVAVLVTLSSVLWINSYLQNKTLLQAFSEKITAYNAVSDYSSLSPVDFAALLGKMDALRAVYEVYPAKENESIWAGFGLYQGRQLKQQAQANYLKQLRNYLLPMIKTRLEQRMVGEESNNIEVLYQLLRVYLMLGNIDELNVDIVRPWVLVDWQNTFTQQDQKQLAVHFDALFQQQIPVQQLDENLIGEVRQILTQIPVAQQVFLRIKSDALEKHDLDMILSKELGAYGGKVFTVNKGSYEDLVIPGLFTYQGFHELFLNESKDLAKQTVEQRWVLGNDTLAGGTNMADLEQKLFKYYYQEFIQRWDDMLSNIKVRPAANINQSVEILEIVSGYDSPLRRLLEAVKRETSLTQVRNSDDADLLSKAKQGVEAAKENERLQKLLNKAKTVTGDAEVVDRTGKEVEEHFKRLNEQIKKGASGSSPLDQVIADLGVLYSMMADLSSTSDDNAALDLAKQGSGGNVIAKIQRQSARLPDPVKSLVKELASGNQGLIFGGVRAQLNRNIRTEVIELCKSSIDNRFPVTQSSNTDITLQDFGKFFAQGGVMDQFFQNHLKDFVDTSRTNWRVISQHNQTAGISASTLKQFQYAARIKEVFFQSGGQEPKVKFELKPFFLDANASRFWINLEGQQLNYRHGPTRSNRVTWPGDQPGLVRYGFETLDGRQLSDSSEGAWGWFKLLNKMKSEKSSSNSYLITFKLGDLTAKYELRANSVLNPFSFTELTEFKCPSRI